MSEFDIIEKYFKPLATDSDISLNLNDDAAIFSPKEGKELIFTQDTIIEDIHFISGDNPATIAKKLLGVNLSDLAAMGATPLGYLMSISLPYNISEDWIDKFSQGLQETISNYGGSLYGGDTTASKSNIALTLTAIGEINANQALKRSGAKDDQLIYVSGTIGDSYIGLKILQGAYTDLNSDAIDYFKDRYHIPRPRLDLGKEINNLASSAIDISDGLIQDLSHITKTSAIGAKIYLDKIPLSDPAKQLCHDYPELLKKLVIGGDDYELLFTADPKHKEEIEAISQKLNLPITNIGQTTSEGLEIYNSKNQLVVLSELGYRHF